MRKWWVGLIVIGVYAYTFAKFVPEWITFILGWLCIFYFFTGYGKKKETKLGYFRENDYNNNPKTYLPGEFIRCSVAGVTFENRQATISKLSVGDSLVLLRDGFNLYDENAIEVVTNLDSKESIGYIPKEIAREIAIHFDNYTTPVSIVYAKITKFTQPKFDVKGVEISFMIPSREWMINSVEDDARLRYPTPYG